jgi:hypothetical protein
MGEEREGHPGQGQAAEKSSGRILDPLERLSEALFGLIMVLTFTCSLSAAEAGREEIRTMLFAAFGCNLAWGIIDAVMYLMARLAEQGQGIDVLLAVQQSADAREGQRRIAAALPPIVAPALSPEELERIRQRLERIEPPTRPRLRGRDWLGALAVFLWVFSITFPVVVPFLLMRDAVPALRVSNLVAIVLLFFAGHSFGQRLRWHPWMTGVAMVVLGSTLVAVTIALGG